MVYRCTIDLLELDRHLFLNSRKYNKFQSPKATILQYGRWTRNVSQNRKEKEIKMALDQFYREGA